jgi:hypothetical protein
MPLDTEMPAPVSATTLRAATRISVARSMAALISSGFMQASPLMAL